MDFQRLGLAIVDEPPRFGVVIERIHHACAVGRQAHWAWVGEGECSAQA
ncbi:MAG: hypothetical protein L0H73_06645 [Nitrococcus sp.]|nr:hypothetical protein [Nitrococcus sp.]